MSYINLRYIKVSWGKPKPKQCARMMRCCRTRRILCTSKLSVRLSSVHAIRLHILGLLICSNAIRGFLWWSYDMIIYDGQDCSYQRKGEGLSIVERTLLQTWTTKLVLMAWVVSNNWREWVRRAWMKYAWTQLVLISLLDKDFPILLCGQAWT